MRLDEVVPTTLFTPGKDVANSKTNPEDNSSFPAVSRVYCVPQNVRNCNGDNRWKLTVSGVFGIAIYSTRNALKTIIIHMYVCM